MADQTKPEPEPIDAAITSQAILASIAKTDGATPEGACVTCPQAKWQLRVFHPSRLPSYHRGQYLDENAPPYLYRGTTSLNDDFQSRLSCFCEMTHTFVLFPPNECDGNQPEQPKE